MSHFIGLAFGSCAESNLNKYDENLEVEPRIECTKETAINKAKEDQKNSYIYLSKLLGKHPDYDLEYSWIKRTLKYGMEISDEEAWEIVKNEWGYELDEDENLITRYNPNSKWDWYQVGGRWSGFLPLKEYDEELKEHFIADVSTVGEIDWDEFFDKEGAPFCFIDEDGEWYERGDMGWFGMVANEKDQLSWEQQFQKYVKTLDNDVEVYAIDFHI